MRMIDRFIDFLLKKRIAVLICAFIVALAGLVSYYVIPKQENPDTTVAAAAITTVYPGASPEEVERNVTNIIEDEIAQLDHIDYYTSSSMNSASVIVIMYDIEVTMDEVEADLRQAVDQVANKLPELAYDSEINVDLVQDNQFIISLSGANYQDNELVEYAKFVKDNIELTHGIDEIVIQGEKTSQLVIEVDHELLKTYGVSIESIAQLLQAQNLSIPSGSISYDDSTINVVTPAVFESIQDVENTVISGSSTSLSFVKIKDVADVYIEEVGDYAYFQDGINAILITGTIQEGQNAVNVGNDLRKVIEEVKEQLPSDLVFHEAMYAPQDIADSINDFIFNLIQSIGLIVIVVMIGVRLKNALIISIALPLSILSTFIIMYILGIEFHFISISSLIVSLGILVDNAIVMSEAIQLNLNRGFDKDQAIHLAIKVNAMPVLTSTLTTIVTFSIVYFVPGVVGKIAGTIPTVVIASLVSSYVVAMVVIPVLAYLFFQPEEEKRKNKTTIMKKAFNKALNFSLKHRVQVIIFSFATLALSGFLALQLGMQFFPVADKPTVYINFQGEAMSYEATNRASITINETLNQSEYVEHYTYAVGNGLPSFFLTVPTLQQAPNVAQYVIQLDEDYLSAQQLSAEEVARDLQNQLNMSVSSGVVSVKNLEYSMPSQATISFSVAADELSEALRVANEMSDHLSHIEGVDNVRTTEVNTVYEYRINLDSEVLSSYGLIKYDVLKQINTALMGSEVGVYQGSSVDMNMILRSDIESLNELTELQVVGSAINTKIDLQQISEVTLQPSTPLIEHYNGQNYVYVLSDVLPGNNSLTIENELSTTYFDTHDLSSVNIQGHGEVANMMDLISNLGISSIVAVFVIYMILVFQFKSYKQPIVILSSIPLSFIGCGFGLWVFNMDIQAMAMIGLVSLFGIVVNNGILLLEVMNERISQGVDMVSACQEALNERYRPILLSTTTTCIGLVPLILSGDAMAAPMASVLLFGLLFSTVLTMVVVPTLYSMQKIK